MNKIFDWFVTLGGLYLIGCLWFIVYPLIHSTFWQGFALLGFVITSLLSLMMSITFFYYGILGKGKPNEVDKS